MLASTTENTHDARILARAIHSPEINFSLPVIGKYYMVDSSFAHRLGYMSPYKSSDILNHFQKFRDKRTGHRRRFHNAHKRFNCKHSSCRKLSNMTLMYGSIDGKFLIYVQLPFPTQVAAVYATIGIHNFLRRSRLEDEAFLRRKTDDDATRWSYLTLKMKCMSK